jgi:hypothetical protein
MVVNGKCSSPHCSHKVGIWTKKVTNQFETITNFTNTVCHWYPYGAESFLGSSPVHWQ